MGFLTTFLSKQSVLCITDSLLCGDLKKSGLHHHYIPYMYIIVILNIIYSRSRQNNIQCKNAIHSIFDTHNYLWPFCSLMPRYMQNYGMKRCEPSCEQLQSTCWMSMYSSDLLWVSYSTTRDGIQRGLHECSMISSKICFWGVRWWGGVLRLSNPKSKFSMRNSKSENFSHHQTGVISGFLARNWSCKWDGLSQNACMKTKKSPSPLSNVRPKFYTHRLLSTNNKEFFFSKFCPKTMKSRKLMDHRGIKVWTMYLFPIPSVFGQNSKNYQGWISPLPKLCVWSLDLTF